MATGYYGWWYGNGLPGYTRFVSAIIAPRGLSVEKLATVGRCDAVGR
jgi:hypothetical protein